jgi:eukaryotic-like serine/threonine-protein kinase
MLTEASYQAMGGVAGALARHADTVIQELCPSKQHLMRAGLLRLVTPERTRAIVPMDELTELSREQGAVQYLVDQMVDARLLVVQNLDGGKGSTVEIVHESLITNWPALRRWLDETQEDAALVDQLRTAARQWNSKGRSPDLLWRGDTAEEAKKFRIRYKGALSDVEAAILDEISLYEKAVARRKRTAVVGAFVGLGALVIASMIALVVIQKSRGEAREAAKLALIKEKEAISLRQSAEDNLEAMKRKELERQQAEAEKAAAEAEKARAEAAKVVATTQLNTAQEDLARKNAELELALQESKLAEARAKSARAAAEISAGEAVAAKNAVSLEKAKFEALFKQESERVKRLQQQIGSPIVDDLK